MRSKVIRSQLFLLGLLPMLFAQYGTPESAQPISGLRNLLCPLGLLGAALYYLGVWLPLRRGWAGHLLAYLGLLCMPLAQLYTFFAHSGLDWRDPATLLACFDYTYPAFYLGLAVLLALPFLYHAVQIAPPPAPEQEPPPPEEGPVQQQLRQLATPVDPLQGPTDPAQDPADRRRYPDDPS